MAVAEKTAIRRFRPLLTVEAMQNDGSFEAANAITQWVGLASYMESSEPEHDEEERYVVWLKADAREVGHTSLEGEPISCRPGDWVVQGITGWFFVVRAEVFAEKYEEV